MSKVLKLTLAVITLVAFTACQKTIPPGKVGKIMNKNGWEPDVIPPGTVYVDTTFTTVPEKLFLVETTTKKFVEPIKVLLKDKLTLKAAVIFRGRISTNPKVLNAVFNDMKMDDDTVTTEEVYHVYGKMIILNTARDIISKYNVDEINKNYGRITVELYNALKPKFKGLPIEISDVTIGAIEYPEIVTKAIERAKEKQMAIEESKAKLQIKMQELKAKEEQAKAMYRIKMLEAKRIRDFNKVTAQGITKDLIKLRELELREKELDKWNGTLPTTYLGNGNGVPVIVNTSK